MQKCGKNPEITRFKGLGEISPDEFKHFIGPKMRLEPVLMPEHKNIKELLTFYARLDSEPFADELLQREETRELVNATMSQLPPHYREALEAKYVSGQSVRDLASSWHVSEKAVESLLTRARAAFREAYGDD